MKHLALACVALFACADSVDEVAEIESANTSYQNTSYQNTSYQNTSYQNTSYQNTSYQGATYGGSVLTNATINGTTLTVRRWIAGGYEDRSPDKICTHNTKTGSTSCTVYLGVKTQTQVSPLAGTSFVANFFDPATQTTKTGTLVIGSGVLDKTAVATDVYTTAMFPLEGHSTATDACEKVPFGPTCGNPNGCRKNCDLWLYKIYLVDTDGHTSPFCLGDNHAFAIDGTWDHTGKRALPQDSVGQFSFVCVGGTLGKCTRWGYRPFGYAKNSAGALTYLPPYHQACARAATADYCANGNSFTKARTLIDVSDYAVNMGSNSIGLIPSTLSVDPSANAFIWESTFDVNGAAYLDHLRYDELTTDPNYGSIDDAARGCPNRFSWATAPDENGIHRPRTRNLPAIETPQVRVSNTGMCSHTEQTVGKYLNESCSPCTKALAKLALTYPTKYAHCFAVDGAWTSDCVSGANACSSNDSQPVHTMAAHSECGADLGTNEPQMHQDDSACTIAVCSSPGYASCCKQGTTNGSWTASCIAQANAICRGGQEHYTGLTQYGFCNQVIQPTNSL